MDSMLNDRVAEGRLVSLEEQLSNLAREAGVSPSGPPTGKKAFHAPLEAVHRLADWRHLAIVGSVLAACIGGAAWWWSSPSDTAMVASPGHSSPPAQTPPKDAAPKDVAPTAAALSSDLAQQFQPMARDLAALRQAVEQLEVRQEQLVRDHKNVASQLEASQAEMARSKDIIDQIKATQDQMARESETVTERLNASQDQLAGVIANAAEPKVSPEQPTVAPEIPLPRPRPSTDVAQARKPAPTPTRPHATSKPQPPAWPWSVR
ncbi:hypothetical protein [Bradyrhizobium sp. USDA 3458]|uniref:hypothetical protein n=1 Tax=Bradyrhizobium sp. USDA 3458 TaxID=2591461 RepID=UPI0011429E13|nr:hypothetical protein [Bradyrhizobium sp. USDA 3458]